MQIYDDPITQEIAQRNNTRKALLALWTRIYGEYSYQAVEQAEPPPQAKERSREGTGEAK